VYRRCVLERPVGQFRQRQTTWITESLAHVGSVLRARFNNGWDSGWEIMELTDDLPETFDETCQQEWALVVF